MTKMPPDWLDRDRALMLQVVSGPGLDAGLPPEGYLRVGDSGPFVADTDEEEAAIRANWPDVEILRRR